jgi:DNA polymerase elongation subunit (family B)
VDILLEVQMNFRLPKYSLNAVAEKFLGEQKDDITPRQLFMLYQITYELLNKMSGKVKRSELVRAKKYVERVMLSHHCHGVVEELRASILAATPKNIYRHLQEAITLTGSYCVQDTILPIKLLNKLNLWTTMKEMSNVMHIPSSYLHTRGQQIKVLAQVYRETIDRGYIIPHQSKLMKDGYKKTTFQGATVIDAVTGDYDNVGTLDFASLYPTVMISFNICYTTFVAPDDPTPDEECHILEWSEHVKCGCPKDKKLPKDKKKKRYCAEHRYRFRKVQIEIDDEGNVIRHHEGLLPRLERNLLATRKEIKREMAKVDARLAMNRGKADAKAIEFYRDKCGYEIIEKGSLSAEEDKLLEITAGILNAKQLAVKVSCNSVAGNTPVPCLVDGVFTYLAIEDLFDKDKFEEDDDENQISKPLHLSSKKVKVWSDNGWTDIKYVMRHKVREPLVRVLTHTGCVDVTPEHSLLRDTGESVTSKELSVGDTLMHNPLPHTSVAELCDFVRVKGGLNAAKFFHSMSMKDYKVTINRVEGDVYEFRREPADRDRIYNSIVAIMPHNRFDEEEYIYDIETKNHHFAAGVGDMIVHNSMYGTLGARTGPIPLIEGAASVTAMGRSLIMLAIDRIMKEFKTCMLVYGDTDSCMIHFKGASLKQSFKLSIKAGKIATHYLKSWIMGLPETYKVGGVYTLNKINPKSPEFEDLTREEKIKVIAYDDIPIDLEFENMYGRFLLLTKKRYLALSYNEDGKVVSKTKKGVVITRRDNSNILKRIYTDVSDAIMEKRPKNEVYQPLYDGVDMLFSRRVPEKDFIIYMGVKDVMGYAKKKKLDETKEDGKEYYVDKDGNPIVNPVGPLDPRLNYPNIPQCLLSLKMIGRGTDIPPNTRLEFLYVRNSDAQHQGDKAEDYLYYKENKLMEGFKIDELHYLEKQILKPVTELLVAKFPPKEIPYENCKDALTRVISSKALLGEYRYNKLYSAKTHTRVIAFETGALDHVVGWTALRHVSKKRSYMRFIDGKTVIGVDREKHRVYTHRTLQGKVWSIFDSVKAGGANDFNPKYEKDREAVDVAKRWWSRQVLDRNYKHYGMKRRPEKRPSTAVKKVPIGTKVSLLRNYEGVERLTVGEVVCMYMESEEDKAPVLHDIIVDVDGEKKRLEAVPRDVFTPFIKVDSKPVHDMFVARKAYRQVLDHLEELFSPFSYID